MMSDGPAVAPMRFPALRAAALALAVAFGPGAAAAAPVFSETEARIAPAGHLVYVLAGDAFDDAGTNPRFTGAVFSSTEYYSAHTIRDGILYVQPRTAAELSALPSPPSSPFTVAVDATMTNDEGETASGTLTFRTAYERIEAALPSEPAEPEPVFSETEARIAPAGVLVYVRAGDAFDNAGTNPRFTGAVFSSTEYYSAHTIRDGILYVQPRTAAELSALPSPPSSPFTVAVDATMTNDEGQTATGTLTFRTTYERVEAALPSEPAEPEPVFSETEARIAPVGILVYVLAGDAFDNAGTNPRFTGAVFSSTEYYSAHTIRDGILYVQPRTAAELSALPSPPSSPFTVAVDATMTNDEGQTATGTLTFRTTYERVEAALSSEPAAPEPVFSQTEALTLRPGFQTNIGAGDAFDNAGTNPRFTGAVFSTSEYYDHWISDGRLWVQAKTDVQLSFLPSPPPSPFTVTADVTMTNDDGQTATGTITFRTTYERDTSEPAQPVFSQTEAIGAPPGETVLLSAADIFDDAGTNPRLTNAVFSTGEYYKIGHARLGMLWLEAKTAEELSALPSPPPSPFTVGVTVTMANDEGKTATGTITFRTIYERDFTLTRAPTAKATGAINLPRQADGGLGLRVSDLFDHTGTNPRFTGDHDLRFSTREYYLFPQTGVIGTVVDGVERNRLWLHTKTDADLNALSPPPPNPFTVDVTVKMINDEGRTATGTFTFRTTYKRDTPAPVFSLTEAKNAAPGVFIGVSAADVFDDAGTNPRIAGAAFSTTAYYSAHQVSQGRLWVQAKTTAELNALASPPPSPFTVTAEVTMTNDEGQTATGTIAFQTTYDRNPASTTVPQTSRPPTSGGAADPPE